MLSFFPFLQKEQRDKCFTSYNAFNGVRKADPARDGADAWQFAKNNSGHKYC